MSHLVMDDDAPLDVATVLALVCDDGARARLTLLAAAGGVPNDDDAALLVLALGQWLERTIH